MARGQVGVVLEYLRRLLGGRGRDPTEDAQLLWRFVSERDEAAFASLLERYGPLVLRVCRNLLHDPHDVEDAFQATILVFVRKAGSLARPDLLGPWLRGVAYRVAMRARAQAARRCEHERRAAAMSRPDPVETSDWRDLGAVLEEEVSRLPEKYRVPFVLCYLEGKTNEQAARCLGPPRPCPGSAVPRDRAFFIQTNGGPGCQPRSHGSGRPSAQLALPSPLGAGRHGPATPAPAAHRQAPNAEKRRRPTSSWACQNDVRSPNRGRQPRRHGHAR